MPHGMEVGLGPGHIVLHGDPAPPPKKGAQQPQLFGPCLLWPIGWMVKMPLGTQVGIGPCHIVLDGDPAPLSKGHISPHNKLTYLLTYFWAHVYCGQTSGCIRIPLGTEVGLGQGNIVLDVDPAPPTERGTAAPPHFSAHVYCGQTVAHLSNCRGLVFFGYHTIRPSVF